MGAIVLVGYAAMMIDVEVIPRDDRPTGTAADIEALRERDDVNVLFILVDTLRADHLGAWGYERPTSPTIDRIASEGVRFSRHVSQSSWTKCSMASLWTGLYPARTGVTRFNHVLSDEARMPAEIMRDAGFRTVGLFRNGWVEGYFGFDQGFEVYVKPVAERVPAKVRRENPTLSEAGTDMGAVEGVEEFLRAYGDQRWFLYVHLMDLHEYLYDEDSALFGTAYADVYDNAIRRTDYVIERLYELLARGGYLENTIVVIGSDHGEAFSERGFEGHARFVYKETTYVPLTISFPFRLEPGIVVDRLTRNIDIWPTVLDLLGLPAMEGVDGRSRRDAILAAARGEATSTDDDDAWAHLDRTWGRRGVRPAPTVSVVDGGYRYVRLPHADGGYDEELFDLSADPAELEDVRAEHAEVAERLRAMADDYLDQQPSWSEKARTLEMDEMQLQQLRALGYKVP
jgi:arylsulfatase A-like enzyme